MKLTKQGVKDLGAFGGHMLRKGPNYSEARCQHDYEFKCEAEYAGGCTWAWVRFYVCKKCSHRKDARL